MYDYIKQICKPHCMNFDKVANRCVFGHENWEENVKEWDVNTICSRFKIYNRGEWVETDSGEVWVEESLDV